MVRRRLAVGVLTLFLVSVVIFLATEILPGNLEIVANFLGEEIIDFTMPRDGGTSLGRPVDINRMPSTFSQKLTSRSLSK
jgi:ABC-type dipeptide/oligopeptide/nickel transport system permease component